MVKGESVRWTKSLRSLDTRPLRAFIIRFIHSFIICISATIWGRVMSAVDGRLRVWSFWSARGIATFRSLLVSFVCTCAFLILFLSVMFCVPLTQLFFQILILFGEVFHCSCESLDLPLQGSGSWFVSLSVLAGRHRVSEYHATLCQGSDSMANLFSHRRHQLMMP